MSDFDAETRNERSPGGVVYVGGLMDTVKKEDLEKEFKDCGKMTSVWVAFNPPGFAFIEFEKLSDAEDACCRYNGTEMLGSKIKVELSHRRTRGNRTFRGREGSYRGSRGGFSNGGYHSNGGRDSSFRNGWSRRGFNRGMQGGGRPRGRGGDFRTSRDYGSRGGYNSGYNGGSRFRSRSPAARQSRREYNDINGPGDGFVQRDSYNQY